MLFKIRIDDSQYTDADYEEREAEEVEDAVRSFAFDRFCALQHVDPGRVLVRYPDGSVVRWKMQSHVVINVTREEVVEPDDLADS
jgi:hypothetical protein